MVPCSPHDRDINGPGSNSADSPSREPADILAHRQPPRWLITHNLVIGARDQASSLSNVLRISSPVCVVDTLVQPGAMMSSVRKPLDTTVFAALSSRSASFE